MKIITMLHQCAESHTDSTTGQISTSKSLQSDKHRETEGGELGNGTKVQRENVQFL